MPEWEYTSRSLDGRNCTARDTLLNGYGLEGWDLVSVDQGIAYFKRPKKAFVHPLEVEINPQTPDDLDASNRP